MSHPNPGHDKSNEYPSDGYSSSKTMALKKKSQPKGDGGFRAALKKEGQNVAKHMGKDKLEAPEKKMLAITEVKNAGAKASAIHKMISRKK